MAQALFRSADPHVSRRRWFWPIVSAAVLIAASASLAIGAVEIAFADVIRVFAGKLGIADSPAQPESVVWGIRMPRVLLGFVVGATLGLVGAVLQGLLRNNLADPHLLGIGPGAAIGAAVGAIAGGVRGAIAGGVIAGVVTAFALRRLARRASIDQTRIILAGVALGAVLSAWVGFIVFGANRASVPPIEFWLLGSLAGSTWRILGTTFFFLLAAVGGLLTTTRVLDLFALGPTEARHLGVDTSFVTSMVLIGCGAAVGATVGAVGVVSFVGLLVPFVVRPFVGHAHRNVLPASMLAGGLFVVLADFAARVVLEPVEIPVGLVTAAVGGPVFLWLLSRRQDA